MSHSFRSLYLHIIFHVGKGYILENDIEPLHAFMKGVLSNRKCTFITLGGTENHIHILANFPVDGISKIIGEAKTSATHWLKKRNANEYARFSWQQEYGLLSVSYSLVPKVRKYILNQKEHHQNVSAEEEYKRYAHIHQ